MKFNTILEIDLKKLYDNASILAKSYSDYEYIFANLKDNAYGMGLKIVNTLASAGVNYCLVGPIQDAILVRRINPDIKILVNYYVDIDNVYDAINNNIALTVPSLDLSLIHI